MRVAIADYEDRVSPVFDVATHLLVVEYDGDREVGREELPLQAGDLYQRAEFVATLGIDALICGAISQPLELLLVEKGITVYGCVCGDVADVLQAFLAGNLATPAFRLPGCQGERRHQWRRGRCHRCRGPEREELP